MSGAVLEKWAPVLRPNVIMCSGVTASAFFILNYNSLCFSVIAYSHEIMCKNCVWNRNKFTLWALLLFPFFNEKEAGAAVQDVPAQTCRWCVGAHLVQPKIPPPLPQRGINKQTWSGTRGSKAESKGTNKHVSFTGTSSCFIFFDWILVFHFLSRHVSNSLVCTSSSSSFHRINFKCVLF